jgi:hypothetical protein
MLERQAASASLIDVLDRVLDKGVVIDAWVALSIAGINLLTIDARIVVASVETYLRNAESVAKVLDPLRSGPPPIGSPNS